MLCDPAGSAFLNIDHDTPTIIFKSIKAIKRRSFALFDLNIGHVSHLPVGPRQDPRDPGLIPAHSAEAAAEPSRRSPRHPLRLRTRPPALASAGVAASSQSASSATFLPHRRQKCPDRSRRCRPDRHHDRVPYPAVRAQSPVRGGRPAAAMMAVRQIASLRRSDREEIPLA
ncbi:hypothetical protein AXF42_Ash002041 [Apostasia shenzhenica]|uniref:Uncharacterized protein n=1 Tax=Apostasia shenzhenica TaxID=1088818 RepID=A0A2I0ABY8_9ASPA|nr:hypothetical protein AXF42_Ash002041 [Apostasia shenzhenica]